MALEAPKIDPRTAADVVGEVETSLEELTPWRRSPEGDVDAGGALVRIFARLAELVIERLNQVPGKSFLAFLDLIGARREPPQPARAPLSFRLVAGSPVDALVPAGTRVAAQPREGEAGEPPVFETERDLVITRSRLAAAFVREGARDLWADLNAVAGAQSTGAPVTLFAGDRPIPHRLYLGHRSLLTLPGDKAVTLLFQPADQAVPWPEDVVWEAWDGSAWLELQATHSVEEVGELGDLWRVDLTAVPPLPASPAAELLAVEYAAETLGGLESVASAWLRARRTAALPRTEDPQPLPRIDLVKVDALLNRDLPADLGFGNELPLDLSKDFHPFGEKPKRGDVLYVAGDEIFSRPRASARLTVTLAQVYFDEDASPPSPLPPNASGDPDPLVLAWEYWDGREWALLGESGPGAGTAAITANAFADETGGLVQDGDVTFDVPSGAAAREVNGETRHWLRVRIAGGHYGVDVRYVPSTGSAEGYVYEPATYRPPVIRSLRLGWDFNSLTDLAHDPEPDLVFSENDFVLTPRALGEPFFAFTPTADEVPTLYLGFERPGDEIGFANTSAALYFAIEELLYQRSEDGGGPDEEPAVDWEYWNGQRWKTLGSRDETAGLTRRGLVTFIGPPDFTASAQFGRRAFWLRARLERGTPGAARLARVVTNTTWASHATTITGEVLGSSRGEPGQVFTATRAPLLAGQELEVREPAVPTAAELETLYEAEGDDAVTVERDDAGRPLAVWVRWHEVVDFHASGPRSRHYVLDRSTGEVRFGDGRHGLVPAAGRGNVRLARYRTGGGVEGNREAGALSQLKGSVPYVDGVVNLEPAAGGAAAESLPAVQLRGPTTLRHRDRAVAPADLEDLARQASTRVARARALAAPVADPGTVGLVIVPHGDEPRPVPSLELLDRVRDYVEARLQPTVELFLAGPDWLRLGVRAEVVPQRLEGAADVRGAVLERLAAFLHPLTGGFDGSGWSFGSQPRRSDFYALIEKTPGVDHVRLLTVSEDPEEGGVRPDRFLVYSGEHEIVMIGNPDEEATP